MGYPLAHRTRLPPARRILGGGDRPITTPNCQRVNARLVQELQGQLLDLGPMLRLAKTTAGNRKFKGQIPSPQGNLNGRESGPNNPMLVRSGIGKQNHGLTVATSRGQSAGM